METLQKILLVITIIGAVNWGLIGLFNYNLVDSLFGTMSLVSRIIYTLVGISAIWAIAFYNNEGIVARD